MISASIVTYKTDTDELNTVLNCAVKSVIDRIYIVDNSPTDELKSFANFSSKVEYVFGHGNVGYGKAHNIAIRKSIDSGAKYHVVVNPDIKFKSNVIDELGQYMDCNIGVGQVMPAVIDPNGELQYLCKLLPSPMDLICRRFLPFKSYVERRNKRFEMRESGYHKIMQVPFLSGCFMFFRTDALRKVGGFSDKYWMYCEDLDLSRRIGIHFLTIYFPNVHIIHDHKKESYKNKKLLKAHIKSAITYFNIWGWLFDSYRRRVNELAEQQYK